MRAILGLLGFICLVWVAFILAIVSIIAGDWTLEWVYLGCVILFLWLLHKSRTTK